MPSKLNIKCQKVIKSGWYWSADHIPFQTERDLINKLYKLSFPVKHVELTITVG